MGGGSPFLFVSGRGERGNFNREFTRIYANWRGIGGEGKEGVLTANFTRIYANWEGWTWGEERECERIVFESI